MLCRKGCRPLIYLSIYSSLHKYRNSKDKIALLAVESIEPVQYRYPTVFCVLKSCRWHHVTGSVVGLSLLSTTKCSLSLSRMRAQMLYLSYACPNSLSSPLFLSYARPNALVFSLSRMPAQMLSLSRMRAQMRSLLYARPKALSRIRTQMHTLSLSYARPNALSLSLSYARPNALSLSSIGTKMLSLVCAPRCSLSLSRMHAQILSLSYARPNPFSGTKIWYRMI